MHRNPTNADTIADITNIETPHMQADKIADITIQVREQSQIEKKLSVTSESLRCSISIYVQ